MSVKQKFIEWFTKNNNGCSPAMEDDRSFVREKSQHMFEAYQAGVAEGEARCAALAAENAGLKESRAILVENTLETCNEIASAGFRHEAIMRGLYESTGNRNKYPKPITTLVDEALRKLETPATDAYMSERGE